MNGLETLFFPAEYFFDEVREGFFVSSMMKRYWAAQLKVLSVVDGICKNNNIRWFAYSGTLLGAVRHGGYIPWDDDLDICMLRDDYIRFCRIVRNELPEGFLFLDLKGEEKYEQLIGRVVNSNVINYGKEHLERFYGCPYTVGIDIFPLDGIYPDEEKENKRFSLECKAMKAGEFIKSGHIDSYECRNLLGEIEKERGFVFDRSDNMLRQILLLLDELFAECPIDEAEYVTLTPACIKDGTQDHKYLKKWFEVQVVLPFENTNLMAPAYYHNILTAQYGDYKVVRKGLGIHDYPVFKEQEQMLRAAIGHNPYRYTFSEQELEAAVNYSKPVNISHFDQVAAMVKEAYAKAEMLMSQGNEDVAIQLLEGCSKLAESVGKELDDLLEPDRKKILFIVSHFEWWQSIEEYWLWASADSEQDVTVLVVPYYIKKSGTDDAEKVDDSHKYSDVVPFVSAEEYDITAQNPDVVIIQDPYDGWNVNFSIPEKYYSENIRNYCKKLVYCPFAEVDDPSDEKDTIVVAMKYFIEQPGLIYADEILVKSEKLRNLYIDTLSELSGGRKRDYWASKIVNPNMTGWLGTERSGKKMIHRRHSGHVSYPEQVINLLGDCSLKKIIVYYTSLEYILINGQKAVDKIKRSFNIMEKICTDDSVTCVFSPQKALSVLETLQPNLYLEISEAVKQFDGSDGCVYDGKGVMHEYIEYADAYYGVDSYFHRKCIRLGIPVMIENLNV